MTPENISSVDCCPDKEKKRAGVKTDNLKVIVREETEDYHHHSGAFTDYNDFSLKAKRAKICKVNKTFTPPEIVVLDELIDRNGVNPNNREDGPTNLEFVRTSLLDTSTFGSERIRISIVDDLSKRSIVLVYKFKYGYNWRYDELCTLDEKDLDIDTLPPSETIRIRQRLERVLFQELTEDENRQTDALRFINKSYGVTYRDTRRFVPPEADAQPLLSRRVERAILDLLEGEHELRFKEIAIRAIGIVGGKESIQPLVDYLGKMVVGKDKTDHDYSYILTSITNIGGKGGLDALVNIYESWPDYQSEAWTGIERLLLASASGDLTEEALSRLRDGKYPWYYRTFGDTLREKLPENNHARRERKNLWQNW